MRVSLIQMNSGSDKSANIEKALKLMKESLKDNPDVICLSEMFLYWGEGISKEELESPIVKEFREFANINNINIILGSIGLLSDEKDKVTNTSLVINRHGDIMHRYDKIYMYTVDRKDLKIDEGRDTIRGDKIEVFELEGIKMGIGICFDLRFPEYFRKLTELGAEMIFLPSSFRKITGQLAWDILPKARAIENQVYFCACNQTGGSGLKARCGNTKIISYNGEVISSLDEEEGYITVDLDIEKLRKFRTEVPVSKQVIDVKK